MPQNNGVNTVTPSAPASKPEELANVSKTVKITVELNEADVQFCFVAQYAKNWFGILPQAKIDAHREAWVGEQVSKLFKNTRKQITERLADKRLLAEAKSILNEKQ